MDANKELRELVALLEGTAHLSISESDKTLNKQNMHNLFNTNSVSSHMWKTFSSHTWTAKGTNMPTTPRIANRHKVEIKDVAVCVFGFMRLIKHISAPWYYDKIIDIFQLTKRIMYIYIILC